MGRDRRIARKTILPYANRLNLPTKQHRIGLLSIHFTQIISGNLFFFFFIYIQHLTGSVYRVLFRCVPYNSCNAAICYSKPLDTTRLAYIPASEWHREGHTHSIHSTFSIYIAYLLFSLHQYLSPLIYSQFLLHLL